jgi:hypothetical protein
LSRNQAEELLSNGEANVGSRRRRVEIPKIAYFSISKIEIPAIEFDNTS